jgi:5-methylcytosine-specific restriction endonuclease McrA
MKFLKNIYLYIRFIFRNPSFSVLNVRQTKEYRKALKEHVTLNPNCAFCGRSNAVDVHHKIPVSFAPELAADKNNLITLCRKPACHLVVGHLGNWKTYNKNVEKICELMNNSKDDINQTK